MNTLAKIFPALLILAAAAPAVRADQVVFKDGRTLQVESIKEATNERVVFTVAGAPQVRRADEVARLVPSGDPNLDRAIRLIEKQDEPPKIAAVLERVLERGADWAKPYAQFFLGELFERYGKNDHAVKAYDKVAEQWPSHFYGPVALHRASELSDGAQAVKRLDQLASGRYGASWKEAAQYGKARLLLKGGKASEAKGVFAGLTNASDEQLRNLAACGEAHCRVLAGDTAGAERTFKRVVNDKNVGPSARGYAWKGLGDCEKDDSKALLAYLRSLLLFPSNPERASAAKRAAELAASLGVGGDRRLTELARGVPVDDYSGAQPDGELARRMLQLVSAKLVQRYAPELMRGARGDELADLEFTAADAIKVIARASNDAALLAEYEALLENLRKKYPNHDRAATAGIDVFLAAKDRALALIGQANDETDEAKQTALLQEGRQLFEDVLGPFKTTIEGMNKRLAELTEKAIANSDKLEDAEEQEKQELTFQRDLAEFQMAEAYASFARTFPEGDEARKKNFEQALQLYDRYTVERGNFQHLLFYSYVGRGEMLIALGKYDDAAMQFEELSFIEAMFMPEDPEGQKAVQDMIKDVAIRAYYGWTRALLMAGRAKDAFEASKRIDDNPKCEGWRQHPVGTLLTFERSKALAGAGRGAQGAQELYEVIQRAQQAPESEKLPGLGMTKLGAGACRALSELSDVTGGEIYGPEVQYYVGVGYFLRRKPVLAIAGYKGVLTAARSEAERTEWVPKAVREIGNLLFQQERFLEAALAYQTVFTEFPDHDLAEESVRFAVSASKKAVDQFGEDPTDSSGTIVKFSKAIEAGGAKSGGPLYEMKLILKRAKEYHEKQQWIPAAQAYLEIKPDYTDEGGQKKRVGFYPNAIANAGYCYFKASQEKKDDQYLKLARENLAKAAEVAGEAGDEDSQALACLYLGQLENKLERAQEALDALRPFDGPLSNATRYLVRARYEQAMACMAKDGPAGATQAEGYFRKVEDRTSDDHYGTFAYHLAVKLRTASNQAQKDDPADLATPRRLRAKAGHLIKLWMDSTEPANLRDAVLFYLGDVLFEGGLYADAHRLYKIALDRSKRPNLDGGNDREAASELQRLDLAELFAAVCLASSGQHDQALEALDRVRRMVYVRDKDDRLVARGLLKERALSTQKYRFTQGGRNVERQVWFTVLEIDGQEVKFFDTVPPQSDDRFQGVQGDDPTKGWQPNEERFLELPLKRDYQVVNALEQAAWAKWEATKDQGFLAKEVTEASNELRFVLRGMDERSYGRMIAQCQLEPTDYELRKWQADVRYLRIKLGRQSWREVASDINQMRLLNKLQGAPDEIRAEIEAIEAEAKSKS